MKFHAQSGIRGRVIDLDTGKTVPKVIWLDEERGELEAYKVNSLGRRDRDHAGDYLTYRAKGRFQFVPEQPTSRTPHPTPSTASPHSGNGPHSPIFLPERPSVLSKENPTGAVTRSTTRIVMGAPECAKCRSPLTLQGDDLCAPCRASERGQRHKMRVESITVPLFDYPCEHRGCERVARWIVSDEVATTPALGHLTPQTSSASRAGKGRAYLFERAATVGRRFYCSHHYQPPRILDPRGEVVEVIEDGGGVRPQ